MTKVIGRNINVNDTAILSSAIALNASTSVLVQAANTNRIFYAISNPENKDIWLKKQSAASDNDKKGIFVPRGGYWEMPADNIYTGEISAIAVSGTPNVYSVEY